MLQPELIVTPIGEYFSDFSRATPFLVVMIITPFDPLEP